MPRETHGPRGQFSPEQKSHSPEPIASERIDSEEERKTLFLDLVENHRGRALRIKERGGKVSSVIVPAAKLREFAELIAKLADYHEGSAKA